MPFVPPPLPLLPVENLTLASVETPTLKWRSDPESRGTLSILFTCLATLSLCAWTVLHLDIPTRPEGRVKRLLRRLGWFYVAVFAPHILLVIAFNQRYLASIILEKTQANHLGFPPPPKSYFQRFHEGCKLRGGQLANYLSYGANTHAQPDAQQPATKERTASPDGDQPLLPGEVATPGVGEGGESHQRVATRRQHGWDMQHALYACMGGYAFDFSDHQAFLPGGETRVTITPFGIAFLLKHYPDLIPDIPIDSIQDRSKADALAKAIVVFQMLWFCLNLIARRAEHLPISLLEISTVAHAISALIIYIIWWDKPHDISFPTVIKVPEAEQACALMSMLSPYCRPVMAGLWTLRCSSEWGKALYRLDSSDDHPDDWSKPESETVTLTEGGGFGPFRIKKGFKLSTPSRWKLLRTLADFRLRLLFGPIDPSRPWHSRPANTTDDTSFVVTRVDLARWSLASKALTNQGLLTNGQTSFNPSQEALLSRHSTPAYSFKYLSDYDWLHPAANSKDLFNQILVENPRCVLTIALPLALYGTPHLFGWLGEYPTPLERILWRASVVALLSPIAVVLALRLVLLVLNAVDLSDSNPNPTSQPENAPDSSPLKQDAASSAGSRSFSADTEWNEIPSLVVLLCIAPFQLTWFFFVKLVRIFRVEVACGIFFGLIRLLLALIAVTLFWILLIVGVLVLTTYPVASTYLVVESFRQLLFLPDGAFNVPSWSGVWPHVS